MEEGEERGRRSARRVEEEIGEAGGGRTVLDGSLETSVDLERNKGK